MLLITALLTQSISRIQWLSKFDEFVIYIFFNRFFGHWQLTLQELYIKKRRSVSTPRQSICGSKQAVINVAKIFMRKQNREIEHLLLTINKIGLSYCQASL